MTVHNETPVHRFIGSLNPSQRGCPDSKLSERLRGNIDGDNPEDGNIRTFFPWNTPFAGNIIFPARYSLPTYHSIKTGINESFGMDDQDREFKMRASSCLENYMGSACAFSLWVGYGDS